MSCWWLCHILKSSMEKLFMMPKIDVLNFEPKKEVLIYAYIYIYVCIICRNYIKGFYHGAY